MNKAVFEKILHKGVGGKNESEIPSTVQNRNTDNEVWENGKRVAKRIWSKVLEEYIWLVFDPSFNPGDGLVRYESDEISKLRGKSPDDIRVIHYVKKVFDGKILSRSKEK